MTAGIIVRLRTTGQLGVVLSEIVGVPAGPDLTGAHRIPVRIVGDQLVTELFIREDHLEAVSERPDGRVGGSGHRPAPGQRA